MNGHRAKPNHDFFGIAIYVGLEAAGNLPSDVSAIYFGQKTSVQNLLLPDFIKGKSPECFPKAAVCTEIPESVR